MSGQALPGMIFFSPVRDTGDQCPGAATECWASLIHSLTLVKGWNELMNNWESPGCVSCSPLLVLRSSPLIKPGPQEGAYLARICDLLSLIFVQNYNCTWWLSGKESVCQCRRCGFDPWVQKIPWRRKWLPTPGFLPGESHGQRSLAGYKPCSCGESDTA